MHVKNYDRLAKDGSAKIHFQSSGDGKKVSVKLNEVNPESTEIIAENIITISQGIKKLRSGRLNFDALTILLHASTKIPKRNILKILNALESLESQYLNKKA